ncbi:MAG: GNAT family N-acetyltransferase [Candidatus Promineifilaceae bacterium]
MKYSLRPAVEEDFDFLYNLKVACLKDYVTETFGWDEEYQQRRFKDYFDPTSTEIIVVNDQDVGQISLVDLDDELFISGIYILPPWQNQGLGAMVLGDVISDAGQKGISVSLQVLKVNPARRLYERLGFTVYEENETHYKMRRALGA